MNSYDMMEVLRDDPTVCSVLHGIFPRDQLPQKFVDGVYVINTCPSYVRDGHWVTIVNQEFFCSFGTHPTTYGLPDFPQYNSHCLQSLFSDVCGLYVLLYAKIKCRGFSLDEFISCFTDNPVTNDDIVRISARFSETVAKWLTNK